MIRINKGELSSQLDPAQVPNFIALRGDPADKLPGALGVGATGAATLLKRYGSLEAALKAGRFPTIAESLRLYRSIATMDNKAPLPNLRSQKPTWHKAAALAREWELKQLASRLEELRLSLPGRLGLDRQDDSGVETRAYHLLTDGPLWGSKT